MPTYEYVCSKCGRFEEYHSINMVLSNCPKCQSEVQRLISQNTNIIFKGSGFHVTDYRSSDYNSKAATENSSVTSTSKSEAETSKGEIKTSKSEAKAS